MGRKQQGDDPLTTWQNFKEPNLNRPQFNDRYGWSLTSSDLDHDGADNLAVGAPGGEPGVHLGGRQCLHLSWRIQRLDPLGATFSGNDAVTRFFQKRVTVWSTSPKICPASANFSGG